jgi:hypothetical protein
MHFNCDGSKVNEPVIPRPDNPRRRVRQRILAFPKLSRL